MIAQASPGLPTHPVRGAQRLLVQRPRAGVVALPLGAGAEVAQDAHDHELVAAASGERQALLVQGGRGGELVPAVADGREPVEAARLSGRLVLRRPQHPRLLVAVGGVGVVALVGGQEPVGQQHLGAQEGRQLVRPPESRPVQCRPSPSRPVLNHHR